MLNADIIGFHSFDHARNFLTACTRLLGLTSSIRKGGSLTVDYNGRHIEVLIDHVSIEPDMLAEWLHGAEVKAAIAGYTEKFKGKKLILALDVRLPHLNVHSVAQLWQLESQLLHSR